MRNLSLLTLLFALSSAYSNGIKLTQVEYIQSDKPQFIRGINVTVSWKNSWNSDRNHDAAWVFFKALNNSGGYRHLYLKPNSARLSWKASPEMPDAVAKIPTDGAGMMVYPIDKYRGDVMFSFVCSECRSRVQDK